MTTIKKEPDLFYLLYLLKIIFLDLFAEIHKSYVTFALPRSPFRFQVLSSGSGENESIFVIFCV